MFEYVDGAQQRGYIELADQVIADGAQQRANALGASHLRVMSATLLVVVVNGEPLALALAALTDGAPATLGFVDSPVLFAGDVVCRRDPVGMCGV